MNARPFANRLAAALCVATVLVTSTHARADDDEMPDARTAGYPSANSTTPEVSMTSSGAGTLAALAVLAAVTVGVMFKNANREPLE